VSEKNKHFVLEFLKLAFTSRTVEAMEMLHPEATWWVLGDPIRLGVSGFRNRAGAERLLKAANKSIPGGMTMIVHSITSERDRVAIEVEGEGVWHDGRKYHNQYHFLITIRNNRIFSVREYMDTLHIDDLTKPNNDHDNDLATCNV